MTTDLWIPADAEQLLSAFLRDQDEVAALVDTRVYTAMPTNPEYPAVQLEQFNSRTLSPRPLWAERVDLQVQAWGGNKKLAKTIAETCRAVIALRCTGVHDAGVVSFAETFGVRDEPDPDAHTEEGRARPRFLFRAVLTVHPDPNGSIS